jgi:hypothetical protein
MADEIEEVPQASVAVYLRWVDGAWEIDTTVLDGHPLDATAEPYLDTSNATENESAALDAACAADMPTGEELSRLLAYAVRWHRGD